MLLWLGLSRRVVGQPLHLLLKGSVPAPAGSDTLSLCCLREKRASFPKLPSQTRELLHTGVQKCHPSVTWPCESPGRLQVLNGVLQGVFRSVLYKPGDRGWRFDKYPLSKGEVGLLSPSGRLIFI